MDTYIIQTRSRSVMVRALGAKLRGNVYSMLASAVRNRRDESVQEFGGRVIQVFRFKPFFGPARYTVCVDRVPVAVAQELFETPRVALELSQLFAIMLATLAALGALRNS